MTSVSFEYYKVFYHIARLGSITLAARTLKITQPALSKSIQHLEKALGCQLFFRRRKGMVLTPEGETLYARILPAYEQIVLGERELRSMLNLGSGEIYIGSSDMILRYYILPHLQTFHSEHPEIKFHTKIIRMDEAAAALRAESIDLAIVTMTIEKHHDLDIMPLGKVHDIFVGSERFRHLEGKVFSLDEVAKLPLVCPDKKTGGRMHYDTFFRKHDVYLSPEFELDTTNLVESFVAAGLGVGIIVREFVGQQLGPGGPLFEIKTEHSIPPRDLYLVIKKKNRLSQAGRKFVNQLLEAADL